MPAPTLDDARNLFEAFVSRLITAQYAEARELLADEAAGDWTADRLAQAWTAMMIDLASPAAVFEETIAVDPMDNWEERIPADVGWVYIPVLNETVNEAVSGIAMETPRGLRIRALEFGRP